MSHDLVRRVLRRTCEPILCHYAAIMGTTFELNPELAWSKGVKGLLPGYIAFAKKKQFFFARTYFFCFSKLEALLWICFRWHFNSFKSGEYRSSEHYFHMIFCIPLRKTEKSGSIFIKSDLSIFFPSKIVHKHGQLCSVSCRMYF